MYLCNGRKIEARILTCLNACHQNVADASRFVFQIFELRKTLDPILGPR